MYFIKKYNRGIFNKYHKKMPVFEMFLKDSGYLFNKIKNYFANNFKNNTILIYPHYASRGSTIYKIAKKLNYNLTNNVNSKYKVAIYWEYLTHREEFLFLEKIANGTKVINLQSRNISKLYVDNAFKKIFQYSTIINPLTYTGKIVKKNDINAKHDGVILDAPLNKIEEGFIYQLLIDNSCATNLVLDYRAVILNHKITDFTYLKFRNISIRFTNSTEKTKIEETAKIFNQTEIDQINNFCKEIKLEYGELDILRDNNSKLIYIVDVNNTPQGPPKNISKNDYEYAINTIAEIFQKEFLEK